MKRQLLSRKIILDKSSDKYEHLNNANLKRGKPCPRPFVFVFLLVFAFALLSSNADAAQFRSTAYLHSAASEIPAITIIQNSPADSEYIESNKNIAFDFTVLHNSSETDLRCNLTIDGVFKSASHANIYSLDNIFVDAQIELSQGSHSWKVACADDFGNFAETPSRSFTIDLTAPVINNLQPVDNAVVLGNYLSINFTPTDNLISHVSCGLYINSLRTEYHDSITSGSADEFVLNNINPGVYNWYINCTDPAQNYVSTTIRSFYIGSDDSGYSVTPNKNEYAIGEGGYLILNAPVASSNVTMFVIKGDQSTFFRFLGNIQFPYMSPIDYTDRPGDYYVDTIFQHGGAIKVVQTHFTVVNNMRADIDVNITDVEVGEDILFDADLVGGVTPLTYLWTFDDDSTSSQLPVRHSYSSRGTYEVRFRVTDSRGNTAEDTKTIHVRRTHNVTFIIKDSSSGDFIYDAVVKIDGISKETDNLGEATFKVDDGENTVYVTKPGYKTYARKHTIENSNDISINLEKKSLTEVDSTDEEADDDNSDSTTAEQDSENLVDNDAQNDNSKSDTEVPLEGRYKELGDRIDSLKKELTAIKGLESSLDSKSVKAFEIFGGQNMIEQGLQKVDLFKRDVYGFQNNRRGLTKEEVDAELTKISKQIDEIRGSVPKQFAISGSENYVYYPTEEDLVLILDKILLERKIELSSKTKKSFIKENSLLQQKLSVSINLYSVHIIFVDSTSSDIVLVDSIVDVVEDTNSKEPAKTSSDTTDSSAIRKLLWDEIILALPELSEISGEQIIPIVLNTVAEKNAQGKYYSLALDKKTGLVKDGSVIFYVNKKVDLELMKKLKIVLIQDPKTAKYSSGITGFSIFGLGPAFNKLDWRLSLELSVIATLIIVFLGYQFEFVDKMKNFKKFKNEEDEKLSKRRSGSMSQSVKQNVTYPASGSSNLGYESESDRIANEEERHTKMHKNKNSKHSESDDGANSAPKSASISTGYFKDLFIYIFGDNKISALREMMQQAYMHLDNKNIEKAHEIYGQIMLTYNTLPDNPKKEKVYESASHLYNELILHEVHELSNQALTYLRIEEKEKAHEKYLEIQELYKQLPKSMKSKVNEKCITIYDRLS